MTKFETKRIHRAWKQIKPYLIKHRDWIKTPGAKNIQTLGEFKSFYKSMVNDYKVSKNDLLVVRRLKSQLRFRTELSTARAALGSGRVRIKDPKTGKYKVYKKESLLGQLIQAEDKEKGIKEKVVSLFEFRNMSTNDIAKLRKEEIKKFYHQLTDGGMKAKDAKKEIAAFYFGS